MKRNLVTAKKRGDFDMQSVVRDGMFAFTVALMFYAGVEGKSPPISFVMIESFLFVDMFMVSTTMTLRIHHLATMGLIAYDYAYLIEEKLRLSLINLEISSFILMLMPYVPNRWQQLTEVLFYCIFAKTRLVDIYPFLKEVETCTDAGVWILYLLSVYWFAIITRKGFKAFFSRFTVDDSYFYWNLCFIHNLSFLTNLALSTDKMFVSFLLHGFVFTTSARTKHYAFSLIPILYDTLQFTNVSVPIVVFGCAILATQQVKPFYELTFLFDNFLFAGLFYSRFA